MAESTTTKKTTSTKPKTTKTVKKEEIAVPAVVEKKVVSGLVVDALYLNVRTSAENGSEVVGILHRNDPVKIDLNLSTDEFYKIVEPIEGFAKKSFIKEQ